MNLEFPGERSVETKHCKVDKKLIERIMDGLRISNKMKMADSYELGEMKDTDQHFQANVKDA